MKTSKTAADIFRGRSGGRRGSKKCSMRVETRGHGPQAASLPFAAFRRSTARVAGGPAPSGRLIPLILMAMEPTGKPRLQETAKPSWKLLRDCTGMARPFAMVTHDTRYGEFSSVPHRNRILPKNPPVRWAAKIVEETQRRARVGSVKAGRRSMGNVWQDLPVRISEMLARIPGFTGVAVFDAGPWHRPQPRQFLRLCTECYCARCPSGGPIAIVQACRILSRTSDERRPHVESVGRLGRGVRAQAIRSAPAVLPDVGFNSRSREMKRGNVPLVCLRQPNIPSAGFLPSSGRDFSSEEDRRRTGSAWPY